MKTRDTTYELKQRILRLGHQKIEEEALLRKIREEIDKPRKDTFSTGRKRVKETLHFLSALREN